MRIIMFTRSCDRLFLSMFSFWNRRTESVTVYVQNLIPGPILLTFLLLVLCWVSYLSFLESINWILELIVHIILTKAMASCHLLTFRWFSIDIVLLYLVALLNLSEWWNRSPELHQSACNFCFGILSALLENEAHYICNWDTSYMNSVAYLVHAMVLHDIYFYFFSPFCPCICMFRWWIILLLLLG